jgi:hypothetical protein
MNNLAATSMINYIFLGFLLLFLADNIINQYSHIPVFVAGGIILSTALLPYIWFGIRKNAWIYFGLVVLFMLMIVNSIKDGFDVKNISDLFFLVLFVICYMAYSAAKDKLKKSYIYVFIVASVLLFLGPSIQALFQSIGNNSKLTSHHEASTLTGFQKSSLQTQTIQLQNTRSDLLLNIGSVTEEVVASSHRTDVEKTEIKPSHYISRSANPGFFRLAHVAAYFLGFSAVFLAFVAFKQKQYLWLLPVVILFYLSLYTLARVFIVALAFSALIYLMRRKYLFYLLPALAAGFLIVYFRHFLFEVFHGTFLQSYFGLVIFLSDYFGEHSRILIWSNWYREISEFRWYEYLTGRSYISGLNANQAYFSTAWWFHNDFLSITYTYGLVGVAFYIAFMRKIFIDLKDNMRGNFYIFLFCVTPVWLAIFNGFYYYFTIFILYMLFVMVQMQSLKSEMKSEPDQQLI